MRFAAKGEPGATYVRMVLVKSDWFFGISTFRLRFCVVLAVTSTIPDTQTARPPLEG